MVFLATSDFMNGGSAQPWWNFTARRKRLLGEPMFSISA